MSEVVGEFAGIMAQAFSGDFSGAYARVKNLGSFMQNTFKNAAEGVKQTVGEIWENPPEPEPTQSASGPDSDTASTKESAVLEKQLAEEREKNERAKMDRQQKINALQAEYNALLAEAEKLNGDSKTKKLIGAEKVRGELDREQKAQADEQAREQEKAEQEAKRAEENQRREEERKADELARAKDQESDVEERNKLAQMSPAEKRDYLTEKQDRLLVEADDAAFAGDDLSATQKRTQAKQMQSEIDSLIPKATDERSVLTVDSLQRLGGGGGLGNVSDPAQRERERQTQLLERIARGIEDQERGGGIVTATLGP